MRSSWIIPGALSPVTTFLMRERSLRDGHVKGWGRKPRKLRMANSHEEKQEEAGRAPLDLQSAALPHSISDCGPEL